MAGLHRRGELGEEWEPGEGRAAPMGVRHLHRNPRARVCRRWGQGCPGAGILHRQPVYADETHGAGWGSRAGCWMGKKGQAQFIHGGSSPCPATPAGGCSSCLRGLPRLRGSRRWPVMASITRWKRSLPMGWSWSRAPSVLPLPHRLRPGNGPAPRAAPSLIIESAAPITLPVPHIELDLARSSNTGLATMHQVNMHEAKSQLSSLVDEVLSGGEVVIARAGKPLARLIPFQERKEPRRPGRWKGQLRVSEDLDATSEDIISDFEGYR
jgi:prevent-host-death family protein